MVYLPIQETKTIHPAEMTDTEEYQPQNDDLESFVEMFRTDPSEHLYGLKQKVKRFGSMFEMLSTGRKCDYNVMRLCTSRKVVKPLTGCIFLACNRE